MQTQQPIPIKRPLMPFFSRRLTETIAIMLVSSIPVFLISLIVPVPSMFWYEVMYIGLFGLSAALYLWLSTVVLRAHLLAVFDVKPYILTNCTILILQGLFCIAGLLWFPSNLYTAFFGYTKPFRRIILMIAMNMPQYFGWLTVTKLAWISAIIFWLIHFIQIIIIPVIRARIQKEFAAMVERDQKAQAEALK